MKTDFFRLSLGPKMRDIAENYGDDVARFMIERFPGGRCFMVPGHLKRGRQEWKALADYLGPERTAHFEEEFSGLKMYIPLGERQALRDRFEAIYHDYKEYSRTGLFSNEAFKFKMKPSESDVIDALASVYVRTKRTIRRIVDTMKAEEKDGMNGSR